MGNSGSYEKRGWRVLDVAPHGPAAGKDLVVYFDFIVGVDGTRCDMQEYTLLDDLERTKDKPTKFTVYNYKTQICREVELIPNDTWGGNGLMGIQIANDDYETANESVVHVLEVFDGSPAQDAGLRPYEDYLLGTRKRQFKNLDDLETVVGSSYESALEVWVYNSKQQEVRLVSITPRKWAGEGSLGAAVGDGLLHKIPELTTTGTVTMRSPAPTTAPTRARPAITQVTQPAASGLAASAELPPAAAPQPQSHSGEASYIQTSAPTTSAFPPQPSGAQAYSAAILPTNSSAPANAPSASVPFPGAAPASFRGYAQQAPAQPAAPQQAYAYSQQPVPVTNFAVAPVQQEHAPTSAPTTEAFIGTSAPTGYNANYNIGTSAPTGNTIPAYSNPATHGDQPL